MAKAKGKTARPKRAAVTKKATGRPRIEFSDEQLRIVQGLGQIGCTERELAAVLGIGIGTVHDRMVETDDEGEPGPFRAAYEKGYSSMTISLRRRQIGCALGELEGEVEVVNPITKQIESVRAKVKVRPSETMQIWCGKQYAGQRDVVESHQLVEDRRTHVFLDPGQATDADSWKQEALEWQRQHGPNASAGKSSGNGNGKNGNGSSEAAKTTALARVRAAVQALDKARAPNS